MMRSIFVAAAMAVLVIGAQAQDRGGWKLHAEGPSIKLVGKPRGLLYVDCNRATKARSIRFSSGVALNKGDEPIRVVFLSFDREEKLTKWVWSYEGRAATLTDSQAVQVMLDKLQTARSLQVSLRPVGKKDLNLRFRPRGAAAALADLRAACSAPAPVVP